MPAADLADLRRLLHQHRPRRARDGYPAAVRRRVAEVARGLVADGWTTHRVAGRLGLAATTLARWLGDDDSDRAAFVPVVVRAEAPAALRPVLVTPGGYRVEGLDVEQLAALLPRLA
jgi:hypothetical protein